MSRVRTVIPEGTRFGKWVTIGPVFRRTPPRNGMQLKTCVMVHCDCGTTQSVGTHELLRGRTEGCRYCREYFLNGGNFGKGSKHKRYLGPGKTKLDIKRAWLAKEKAQPCVDCGRSFPSYCMELDHIPERGEKLFMVNLGSCSQRHTLEELKAERKKCDLVCSVCHNHRTWERINNIEHTPLPAHFFEATDG